MSMGGKEDGGAGKAAKAQGKQAAAAAKKLTEYGDKAVSFTDTFYNKYIVPELEKAGLATSTSQANAQTIFEQQQGVFADREGSYQAMGKPAIQKYFDQVNNFDPEAEAQRQGLTMSGDVASGLATARASTMRGLSDRGINPNSGSTIAALGRQDTAGALVKAKEMARLRSLTNQQKMGMVADAGKFGAGMGVDAAALAPAGLQAGVIGSDITSSGIKTATIGAGIPMEGIKQASNNQGTIFAPTKAAEAGLQQTSAQAKAADGGIGGLLGTVAGAFLGGPGGAAVGKAIFG